MKTRFNFFDPRQNKNVELERIETSCNCLGCFFLDEETADCLMPMPIEFGADCMEGDKLHTTHFQFNEI